MGKILLNGIEYSSGGSSRIQPVIYSQTETEVGVWIDNKPLYQKSFATTYSANGTYSIDISSLGIDSICNSFGEYQRSNGEWTEFNHYAANTYYGELRVSATQVRMFLQLPDANPNGKQYFTIQYTKTADVAGSGTWNTSGIPNVHYSATEHVVGTWIDGKPIYEITVDTGTLPNNTTKTIAHGISDLKAVIDLRGYARNTNNGINIPIPYVYKSGSYSKSLQAYSDATNITFISGENMSGYTESYVTLQYTKTTD